MPSRFPTWFLICLFVCLAPSCFGQTSEGAAKCQPVINEIKDFKDVFAGSNPTVKFLPDNQLGLYYTPTGSSVQIYTTVSAAGCDYYINAAGLINYSPRLVKGHARNAKSQPLSSAAFGTASTAAVGGDFNGDGNPDFAALNTSQNTVTVLLTNSDGSLQPATPYAVGITPTTAVFADVNGDGVGDILTANYGDHTVSVLLGNHDGTFQAARSYPAGAFPEYLAVADVNADGKPDLIVGYTGTPQPGSNGRLSGGTISVMAGKGDGSFGAATVIAQAAPLSLVAVDLNQDGKVDVAYGDYNLNGVGVLLGNGAGGFAAPVISPVTGQPSYLGYGDFNNDGIEDLAVLNSFTSTLSILLGTGAGAFQAPRIYVAGNLPPDFSLLDFNNDGNLDFAVIDAALGGISYVFGNGMGTFLAPRAFPVTSDASLVAAGDFNGDGKPDFVVADSLSGAVTLFLNPGQGEFGPSTSVSVSSGLQPVAMAAGDFNGDGKADLLIASQTGFEVVLGSVSAVLAAQPLVALNMTPAAIATGDFNGDGMLDFAVAGTNGSQGNVAVFYGNGTGTFLEGPVYAAGASLDAVAVADLNGDGHPDLIVAGTAASGETDNLFILLNAGTGNFASASAYQVGTQITAIAAGDINRDGKSDIVLGTVGTDSSGNPQNQLAAMLGNGDGTLAPASFAPVDRIVALVLADFNGDSNLDVVASNCCGANDLNFLAGNGDGTFQSLLEVPSGPSPEGLAVADFNGDGKPDLLIAASKGGSGSALNLAYAVVMINSVPALVATVNSASFDADDTVATESIAASFGADLANTTAAATSLSTSLGGTTAMIFDSAGAQQPATLLFVSPQQVNFAIPAGLADGPASIVFMSADGTTSLSNFTFASTAPGIYTYNGQLAAAQVITPATDGSFLYTLVAQPNPAGGVEAIPIVLSASTASYLVLYGTGIRHADLSTVSVQVGDTTLIPAYAGAQGIFVGFDQINVELPYSLKGSGDVPVTVSIAGEPANTVHVVIQ